MRSKSDRILVTGAGLAGPTLAYWLVRAGFRPTIVERAPSLRPGGYGVDVREQAVEVAEQMGIFGRIRAARTDIRGLLFVDGEGRESARIDMGAIAARKRSRDVEILRGDLSVMLHDLTADDVEYRFADSVTALHQDPDGVDVTFDKGAPGRFDLVVGADGLHSTTRRLVFGEEGRFVHHRGLYGAVALVPGTAPGERRWATMHSTPGAAAGVYRSGSSTESYATFLWRSGPLEIDPRDLDAQRRLIAARFAGQGPLVDDLIAATSDPGLYFDSVSQVRMPSWSSGRVALVGDAAHCASPVSGQGSTLAMVGAYRLAGELAASQGDHRGAFARYEAGFRRRAEKGQARAAQGTRLMVPASRLGVRFRDLAARSTLLGALAGITDAMESPAAEPLPSYAFAGPRGGGRQPRIASR